MVRRLAAARWLLLGLLGLAACSEDPAELDQIPALTAEVQDYANLEFETLYAIDLAETVFAVPSASSTIGPCLDSVRRQTTGSIRELRIVFDSTVCSDGRVRDGVLLLTWAPGPDSATVPHTIRTLGYVVNGSAISIHATSTYNATTFTRTVVSTDTLTYPGGTRASWQMERSWEWVTGRQSSVNVQDDEYAIRGEATLVSRANLPVTVLISNISPLLYRRGCPSRGELVAGQVQLLPASGEERLMDYGLGDCDGTATYSAGGLSTPVVFR